MLLLLSFLCFFRGVQIAPNNKYIMTKEGDYMLKNFLKDDGENIIFTGEYMEAYIPSFYFEGKLAEDYGSSLQVFGLFNVRVFDAAGKGMKLETFNVPSMIHITPSEIEKRRDVQLIEDDDGETDSYIVAKFYKGNVIMKNSVPQDSSNVELFINVLFRGKVPKTIPYRQVCEIWQKNLDMNGVKLGVTSTILEVIVSEIYRNKKKPEEKFAHVIGKNPKTSEYAYRRANIRQICAWNSTFAGLTFEDMDSMITSALNTKRYGKKETKSPIEKIIKM